MNTLRSRALACAAVHFLVSVGIFWLAFSAGSGSGLSDSYHGDQGLGFFTFILVILQAPVALIQWLVGHFSSDGKTGLPAAALAVLAMLSSVAYGYVIARLVRSSRSSS